VARLFRERATLDFDFDLHVDIDFNIDLDFNIDVDFDLLSTGSAQA